LFDWQIGDGVMGEANSTQTEIPKYHFVQNIGIGLWSLRDGSVGPRGLPGAPLGAGELCDNFDSSAFVV
jgi:hypothetical protein